MFRLGNCGHSTRKRSTIACPVVRVLHPPGAEPGGCFLFSHIKGVKMKEIAIQTDEIRTSCSMAGLACSVELLAPMVVYQLSDGDSLDYYDIACGIFASVKDTDQIHLLAHLVHAVCNVLESKGMIYQTPHDPLPLWSLPLTG